MKELEAMLIEWVYKQVEKGKSLDQILEDYKVIIGGENEAK